VPVPDGWGLSDLPGKDRPWTPRATPPLPLLCLLVLTWLVHLRTFAPRELGQDGYFSVDLALDSLQHMATFTARDVHPPLFYALLHYAFVLGGVNDLAAKLVPVSASVLAVVFLYRIGLALR
jgi:predicted membrane-bound mannosyltransferase